MCVCVRESLAGRDRGSRELRRRVDLDIGLLFFARDFRSRAHAGALRCVELRERTGVVGDRVRLIWGI